MTFTTAVFEDSVTWGGVRYTLNPVTMTNTFGYKVRRDSTVLVF
jgi:hypothetical protein